MDKDTDLIYRAMSEGVRTASEFAQYKKGYRMNSNSMISNELLSEVLGFYPTTTEYNEDRNELSLYELNSMGEVIGGGVINLYELAHKCKEWADRKGICLDSRYSGKCILRRALHSTNKIFKKDIDKIEVFTGDTEPEAIFKACEWILEQKRIDDES